MNSMGVFDFISNTWRKMMHIRYALRFQGTFAEVFVEQQYLWLFNRIKPKTIVIDIGGYMGDSSIYFAMNSNVSSVLAFEPSPILYYTAVQHLKQCPLSEKITFSNKAVTADGITRYLPKGVLGHAGNNFLSYKTSGRGAKIETIASMN